VTAYEHGLDNVTEEAVSAVVYAVENHLKDILTSVVSRRKAYRLRDGHFKYAFGSNVTPQPYLKNSVVAYNNLIERYMKFLVISQPFFLVATLLHVRPLLNNWLLCFCKV